MPVKSLSHMPYRQLHDACQSNHNPTICPKTRLYEIIEELVGQFSRVGFADQVSSVFTTAEISDKLEVLPYTPSTDYISSNTERLFTHQLDQISSRLSSNSLKVIFDLDETLVHACADNGSYKLCLRPMVRLLIRILANMPGVEVMAWTAGHKGHAAKVLDIIDPDGYIKVAICRDPSYQSHNDPKWRNDQKGLVGYNKSFQLLPDDIRATAIIFDNTLDEITDTNGQGVHAPNFGLAACGRMRQDSAQDDCHALRPEFAQDTFIFQVLNLVAHLRAMISDLPGTQFNVPELLQFFIANKILYKQPLSVPAHSAVVSRFFTQPENYVVKINPKVFPDFNLSDLATVVNRFTSYQKLLPGQATSDFSSDGHVVRTYGDYVNGAKLSYLTRSR